MKITTFNPQIITKNAEPLVKLFEELGFEKRHNPEGIGELNVEGIRLKQGLLLTWYSISGDKRRIKGASLYV